MPIQSDFLSAERLPHSQILNQTRQVGDSPVLIAMLDSAPGMVACGKRWSAPSSTT